jgi:hypothetical protein
VAGLYREKLKKNGGRIPLSPQNNNNISTQRTHLEKSLKNGEYLLCNKCKGLHWTKLG